MSMSIRLPTSDFGFNEGYYLSANPDVAALVQQGVYPSGRAHYEELGRLQGRTPMEGGNTGSVLPRGIQRWRQSVNGDNPLMPLGSGSGSPFVALPPAADPSANAGASATPALGGGPPQSATYGYQHDGQGGYSNDGMGGKEIGGPSGSTATGSLADIGGWGRLGSVVGNMFGGTLAGLGLGAIGRGFDVSKANDELDALGLGRPVGMLGLPGSSPFNFSPGMNTFSGAQAQKDAVKGIEARANMIDRRDAVNEEDAAGLSAASQAMARANELEAYNSEAAAREAAAAAAATANAQAQAADVMSEMNSGSGGGGNGGGAAGTESGGGQGGMTGDRGDPGDGGDFALGGRIRRRFASGGLNIQPWDTINADVDKRGLTSASAYESTGQKMALGGMTQPGNNPIHAALGTQVRGPGTGRSDEVPAMLSPDEYVIPADVVAALGDGSSNAGAKKLADLVVGTRAKYRKKLGSLPPPKA